MRVRVSKIKKKRRDRAFLFCQKRKPSPKATAKEAAATDAMLRSKALVSTPLSALLQKRECPANVNEVNYHTSDSEFRSSLVSSRFFALISIGYFD